MTAVSSSSTSSATSLVLCTFCQQKTADPRLLEERIRTVANTCMHDFCGPCFASLTSRCLVYCPWDGAPIQSPEEAARARIPVHMEWLRHMRFFQDNLQSPSIAAPLSAMLAQPLSFALLVNEILCFLLAVRNGSKEHRVLANIQLLNYIDRYPDLLYEGLEKLAFRRDLYAEIIDEKQGTPQQQDLAGRLLMESHPKKTK